MLPLLKLPASRKNCMRTKVKGYMLKSRYHCAWIPWSQGPQLWAKSCKQNIREEQSAFHLKNDYSSEKLTPSLLCQPPPLKTARRNASLSQKIPAKAKCPNTVKGHMGLSWRPMEPNTIWTQVSSTRRKPLLPCPQIFSLDCPSSVAKARYPISWLKSHHSVADISAPVG